MDVLVGTWRSYDSDSLVGLKGSTLEKTDPRFRDEYELNLVGRATERVLENVRQLRPKGRNMRSMEQRSTVRNPSMPAASRCRNDLTWATSQCARSLIQVARLQTL
jgi:hypothetical protein